MFTSFLNSIDNTIQNKVFLTELDINITKLLDFCDGKVDKTNPSIQSLKKSQQQIRELLPMAVIATPIVIAIVKNIVEYHKEIIIILKALGYSISFASNFIPCGDIIGAPLTCLLN